MPPPSIPGGWTDTADKQLLLAVLAVLNPQGTKSIDWNQVVAIMGNGATVRAANSRFAAIRNSVGAGPTTPAKKGIAKKTGSTGKRKASKDHDVDEVGDEEEENKTPVKKAKKEVVKQEVPKEDDDDDGLL